MHQKKKWQYGEVPSQFYFFSRNFTNHFAHGTRCTILHGLSKCRAWRHLSCDRAKLCSCNLSYDWMVTNTAQKVPLWRDYFVNCNPHRNARTILNRSFVKRLIGQIWREKIFINMWSSSTHLTLPIAKAKQCMWRDSVTTSKSIPIIPHQNFWLAILHIESPICELGGFIQNGRVNVSVTMAVFLVFDI